MYVESNNSTLRARTELSSIYKFANAVVLENELVGHLPIPCTSCPPVFKDCKNIMYGSTAASSCIIVHHSMQCIQLVLTLPFIKSA